MLKKSGLCPSNELTNQMVDTDMYVLVCSGSWSPTGLMFVHMTMARLTDNAMDCFPAPHLTSVRDSLPLVANYFIELYFHPQTIVKVFTEIWS